ncbi:MAG TPA: AMIN domain-containing protein, partial [Candidatus Polarisedimenticolia bacterium]|nr:AMIN domain-containing protein [Candidatus Polarisedimenticolia bacterium]
MMWVRMVGATVLTLCVAGCAANKQISDAPAVPLPAETAGAEATPAPDDTLAGASDVSRIESITAESEAGMTRVVIKGDHPLSYTSYDPDAATLVLELPGVSLGQIQPVITVGTPQLTRIETTETPTAGGGAHTRIELAGRNSATTRIEPHGADLVIFLEGTGNVEASTGMMNEPGTGMAAPMGDAPMAQMAPMPTAPKNPASHLTDIQIEVTKQAPVVTLEADGELQFSSFEMENPPRLVLDLQGVTKAMKARKLPVGSGGVDQVRVSQFATAPEMVTRVVIDMTHRGEYTFTPGDNSLSITFD